MSAAPLSAAQLHEPILPLAQPRVVLQPRSDHRAIARLDSRFAPMWGSIHYFYVVERTQKLVGVVPTRGILTAQPPTNWCAK